MLSRSAGTAGSSSSDEEVPKARRRRRELHELRAALSRGEANLLAATRRVAISQEELEALQARYRSAQAQLRTLREELLESEHAAATAVATAGEASQQRERTREAAAAAALAAAVAEGRAREALKAFRVRLADVEARVAEERAARESELLRMESLVRQLSAQLPAPHGGTQLRLLLQLLRLLR